MGTINNCSALWNAEYLFRLIFFSMSIWLWHPHQKVKGQAVSEEGLFWDPT